MGAKTWIIVGYPYIFRSFTFSINVPGLKGENGKISMLRN